MHCTICYKFTTGIRTYVSNDSYTSCSLTGLQLPEGKIFDKFLTTYTFDKTMYSCNNEDEEHYFILNRSKILYYFV